MYSAGIIVSFVVQNAELLQTGLESISLYQQH